MQILERNLTALGRADPALAQALADCARGPDLEVRPARAGGVALAIGGRFDPGGSGDRLDIAVIPPLQGGSLPVAHACARAFRALGHRVREPDLEPFWPAYQALLRASVDLRLRGVGESLRGALVRIIGELLLASFRLRPPDLVFVLAQAPLDARALAGIGSLGIPQALWFCEDFHVMRYWAGLARDQDVIFHVQPGAFDAPLREAGGLGHPLPMAFDPELHRPVAPSADDRARYGADLSFVGAAYHNRVKFLPALVPLGLRIWGTGWPALPPFTECMPEPNAHQSSEASNKIFNASRINLNLHSSPWTDGVNPVGDYLDPRTFELAGAGAFQLVDERSELAAAFEPGVELETFRDLEECRRKIRHFLAHPDERAALAAAGRRRALAEHTYAHRLREALGVLEAGPVPVVPRRSAPHSVSAAADAAVDDPELQAIPRRADPDLDLDPEAIRQAVSRGSGPLSRDELLLLYLREALDLIGATGAAELAAVLARCRVLLTGDTGTMHLAAAVGTRTCAVFVGVGNPWETAAYAEDQIAVMSRIACAPCQLNLACGHPACHEDVPAGFLGELLARMLRGEALDALPALPRADVYRTRFGADRMLDLEPLERRRPEAHELLAPAYRALFLERFEGVPTAVEELWRNAQAHHGVAPREWRALLPEELPAQLGELKRIAQRALDLAAALGRAGGDPGELKRIADRLAGCDGEIFAAARSQPLLAPLGLALEGALESLPEGALDELIAHSARHYAALTRGAGWIENLLCEESPR